MKKIICLSAAILLLLLSSCSAADSSGTKPLSAGLSPRSPKIVPVDTAPYDMNEAPHVHRTEGNVYRYKGDPKPLSEKETEKAVKELKSKLSDEMLRERYDFMLAYKNGGERSDLVPCDSHEYKPSDSMIVSRSYVSVNGWHIEGYRPQYVCKKCGCPSWGEFEYTIEPHIFRTWYFDGTESHDNDTHTFEFEGNCSKCLQYAIKKETVECTGEPHAYVGDDGLVHTGG